MSASTVPGFSTRQLWLVLGSLMLSVMLATMEVSIISTALPTIVGEFQSFENFAWVGTSYIVAAAIGTPLWGKLSDLYGRRLIFLTALGVFVCLLRAVGSDNDSLVHGEVSFCLVIDTHACRWHCSIDQTPDAIRAIEAGMISGKTVINIGSEVSCAGRLSRRPESDWSPGVEFTM